MHPLDRLPPYVAGWPAALASFGASERDAVGTWVLREWIEGRLEPLLLAAPADTAARWALRKTLAVVVASLGSESALETEWGPGAIDEATARRWCWIVPWILLSQDEDLLLMDDHLAVPLLDEARAGCPKRAYVLAIVEHHVRDQVNAALRKGPDAVRARIRELSGFRDAAARAPHEALVTYIDRLARYERPSKVDRDEARQRVVDLWRCHAPPSVTVEAAGATWRARTSTVPAHEEWIVISAKTGAMHLEAAWQERAAKRGRRKA